jgi:hypothetical protein
MGKRIRSKQSKRKRDLARAYKDGTNVECKIAELRSKRAKKRKAFPMA